MKEIKSVKNQINSLYNILYENKEKLSSLLELYYQNSKLTFQSIQKENSQYNEDINKITTKFVEESSFLISNLKEKIINQDLKVYFFYNIKNNLIVKIKNWSQEFKEHSFENINNVLKFTTQQKDELNNLYNSINLLNEKQVKINKYINIEKKKLDKKL